MVDGKKINGIFIFFFNVTHHHLPARSFLCSLESRGGGEKGEKTTVRTGQQAAAQRSPAPPGSPSPAPTHTHPCQHQPRANDKKTLSPGRWWLLGTQDEVQLPRLSCFSWGWKERILQQLDASRPNASHLSLSYSLKARKPEHKTKQGPKHGEKKKNKNKNQRISQAGRDPRGSEPSSWLHAGLPKIRHWD